MKEYVRSISPKGQITIPLEVRKLLGVKPKDKVAFRVEEGEVVKITSLGSQLEARFMAVPPLKRALTFGEMADIAREEQAQEAAREGL